ncbi:MAG: ribosome maturation factor RimM [Cyclobacteriaceae bacterium]
MLQVDCYQLGEVIKTHGLAGEVSISLDVDFPEDYKKLESVFLKRGGKLIPFFVSNIQINGDKALVQFEDIDSVDEAKSLVKSEIFLPLTQLPKLPKGEFYFHDLIGCEVFEKTKLLGVVKDVYEGANELMAVYSGEREILIPLINEVLKKVDVEARKVEVELPEGLLDLYDDESS